MVITILDGTTNIGTIFWLEQLWLEQLWIGIILDGTIGWNNFTVGTTTVVNPYYSNGHYYDNRNYSTIPSRRGSSRQ
jgi:hypothetical protein